ncbi:MAG TPA: hypothetical protein VD763_10660 [Candidatus Saccharimonadales bacterium]|nr:hypothetical protein [Candidatus Saccharimonadales bacterium]
MPTSTRPSPYGPRRRRLALAISLALTAGTVAAAPALAARPPIQGAPILYTLHGDAPSVNFGWAIAELSDIDGDGVTDLITGDPFRTTAPQAYVFSGADGTPLFTFSGDAGDYYAYAVADAGDTDGDGVSDILVGNPEDGVQSPGRVELRSGASGAILHTFVGDQPNSQFGTAVGAAGDVDGDGHADVLVGAETSDGPAGSQAGRVLVYSGDDFALIRTLHGVGAGDLFGSATDVGGDLDGDGVRDHLVGARGATAVHAFSGADGGPLWTWPGRTGSVQLGSFFVGGLEDIDGDDVPDVYAGDYADRTDGVGAGAAFVLSGVDGSPIHTWSGRTANEGMGPGREAGDLDRDGVQDLAVGSYTSSARAAGSGMVQIFSGRTGDVLGKIKSRIAGENLGFDAVGLGDVNGDGRDDIALSAASGNTIYVVSGRLD